MKVYLIKNTVNSKCYVGVTKRTVEDRWKLHKKDAAGQRSVQTIHNAIRKYGVNEFEISEIDSAENIPDLYEKEKYWIAYYNTKLFGYNETNGGEGTLGLKLSKERKEILRKKANERWNDPQARAKQSILMKEYYKENPVSEETRKLQSINSGKPMLGKFHTEETKQKMRQNSIGKNKGIIRTEETKEKLRKNSSNSKIRNIEFFNGDNMSFSSLSEASRTLDIPKVSLKYIANNNGFSTKHNIKRIITQ